jgi:hypothetical protein
MAEKSWISGVALIVAVVAAAATVIGAVVVAIDSQYTRGLLCTRFGQGCIRKNIFTIYTLEYHTDESARQIFGKFSAGNADCLQFNDFPTSSTIPFQVDADTRKITKIANSDDQLRNRVVTGEGRELIFLLNSKYPPMPAERTLDITVTAFRDGYPVSSGSLYIVSIIYQSSYLRLQLLCAAVMPRSV